MSYWLVPGPSSYPQRHHLRLAGYDYRTAGFYFVTVYTQHRVPLFGTVDASRMRLNGAGLTVQATWHDLVRIHPGVAIDAEVTMPDHVHALVVLEDDPRRTLSLSDVLHRYTSLTAKRYAQGVRNHGWPRYDGRLWQESFYDHVIRRDEELDAVRHYIGRRSTAAGAAAPPYIARLLMVLAEVSSRVSLSSVSCIHLQSRPARR